MCELKSVILFDIGTDMKLHRPVQDPKMLCWHIQLEEERLSIFTQVKKIIHYVHQQTHIEYVQYYGFICTYRLFYMFRRVFVIFRETMRQRNYKYI